MKSNNIIVKKYLEKKFKLNSEQLLYELGRFDKHKDIGAELSQALEIGKFPESVQISVRVDEVNYTAQILFEKHYATTIYAAYSLLTQLRDHPEIVQNMKKGFKVK